MDLFEQGKCSVLAQDKAPAPRLTISLHRSLLSVHGRASHKLNIEFEFKLNFLPRESEISGRWEKDLDKTDPRQTFLGVVGSRRSFQAWILPLTLLKAFFSECYSTRNNWQNSRKMSFINKGLTWEFSICLVTPLFFLSLCCRVLQFKKMDWKMQLTLFPSLWIWEPKVFRTGLT